MSQTLVANYTISNLISRSIALLMLHATIIPFTVVRTVRRILRMECFMEACFRL